MANPLMEKANRWHKVGFLYAVAGSSFLIVLGVLANVAGFAGLNFLFAAVTIISALYFLTKPAMVLTGFGFGALLSGLSDLSLKESLEASIKPIGLLFLFVTIVFVTLATFPIANAAMVLPLIVVLAGLQLATLVKRPGYKMLVVTILLFSGCLTLYKMYVRPTKTALAAGEILKMNQENLDKQKANDIEKLREKLKNGQVLTPEEIKLVEENVAASKGESFFEKIGAFFAAKPQTVSSNELAVPAAPAAATPAPAAAPAPVLAAEIQLSVGQEYGGGIIAYILKQGDNGYNSTIPHGLIAAKSDIADISENFISWEAARVACLNLVENGYSDWHMPNNDELHKLYNNRLAVGGFVPNAYWSSSPSKSNFAWFLDFDNGTYYHNNEVYVARVRAVRRF